MSSQRPGVDPQPGGLSTSPAQSNTFASIAALDKPHVPKSRIPKNRVYAPADWRLGGAWKRLIVFLLLLAIFAFFLATMRPTYDSYPQMFPVSISKFAVQKHKWIDNYQVFIGNNSTALSFGDYIVLVMIPKVGVNEDTLRNSIQQDLREQHEREDLFVLRGAITGGDEKPVSFNLDELIKHPAYPETKLLDCGNGTIILDGSRAYSLAEW